MMKISPVNGHLLIEPVKHDAFMATERSSYDEIGVVVAAAASLVEVKGGVASKPIHPGDRVYFDSWLAKKYPKEGSTDEFFWLVKWEDVSAVEYAEQPISE